jgi:hypothetical protein
MRLQQFAAISAAAVKRMRTLATKTLAFKKISE